MRLEAVPLFQGLDIEVLREETVLRHYGQGELIFLQGEPSTGLWVLLEGRAAVERSGQDGVVQTTGLWAPGDIIGIAGVWDGSPYPGSARTLDSPTVVAWLERSRFLEWHRRFPDFALAISRALAERLRRVQELNADLRGRPVALQVALLLRGLAERSGPELLLTHEELARMAGVSRETVTRTLHAMADRGWIQAGHGRIHLLRLDALERWIERRG